MRYLWNDRFTLYLLNFVNVFSLVYVTLEHPAADKQIRIPWKLVHPPILQFCVSRARVASIRARVRRLVAPACWLQFYEEAKQLLNISMDRPARNTSPTWSARQTNRARVAITRVLAAELPVEKFAIPRVAAPAATVVAVK